MRDARRQLKTAYLRAHPVTEGCLRLGYASEAESRIDRINWKLQKLQAKLGEDGEKPKWMRWRTFDRICEPLDVADAAWGLMVLARLGPDGAM